MSLGFSHTIKKNHNNERVKHILVFDVESKVTPGDKGREYFEPFLWTLIYHRHRPETGKATTKKLWGKNINKFWDHVESFCYSGSRTMLSSHHLEPDFIPLQGIIALPARGWKLTRYISHARILLFEFRKGKKNLTVVNSGNVFPGSIALWGDSLGLPKIDMPGEDAPIQDWVKYCMRDSEVLLGMWLKYFEFIDLHDLGNMQFTAASQAMTAFRHRFMEYEISIHEHEPTLILERRGYHGGRFQALVIGTPKYKKYWRLDINSMYGQIMRDESLPRELRGYQSRCKPDKLKWLLDRYLVIADLEISTEEPFFPVKVNEKVTYPTGRHWVTFCTPEIKYILEHGTIHNIGNVSWYKHDRVFNKYTDYFLSLRAEYKAQGDKVFEMLAKLFNNSLYGKFGQYGYAEKIVGECDPDLVKYEESYDVSRKRTVGYFFYGGKIRVTERTNNSYNTFVAIAAHITALGRMRLWSLMKMAGLHNVFHVATDSLIVNRAGLMRLGPEIDKAKVGALKIEADFSSLTVKAPNDMVMDGAEKIKGVNKKAIKEGENTYTITAWSSFNALFKKGEIDQYYIKKITKTLKRSEFMSMDEQGNNVRVIARYK